MDLRSLHLLLLLSALTPLVCSYNVTNSTTATPYTSTSYSNSTYMIISNYSCAASKEFPSLTLVVDTTGSMYYTLSQLKDAMEILLELLPEQSPYVNRQYTLMEFNDPYVGPLHLTCSSTQFGYYVNNLYAYDGGDCPELAMTGLLSALENSPVGSLVVVVTDASAKDYYSADTMRRIYSLIASKAIKVIFLSTGYCYSMSSSDYTVYKDIASLSYGHVFQNFYSYTISNVVNFLDFMLWIPINSTTKVFSIDKEWYNYVGNFSINTNFSSLVVSVSGMINSLNLTGPFGGKVNTRTVISEQWGSLLIVNNPKIGIWNINIYASSSYSVRIEGYTATNTSSSNTSSSHICSKCDVKATCEEFLGAKLCFCKDGFTGNGYNCSDFNECLNYYTNNCYDGICINTNGSYTCACYYGYENSTNNTCIDIDECSRPDLNRCHERATCINYRGSYSCYCPDGYYGDGFYCEFNECTTRVCGFGLECVKSNGSYSCLDPCVNHTALNQPWRRTSYSAYYYYGYCDSYLNGWYRFTGSGGTLMPEYCPSAYSCYTTYPIWLNGYHPQLVDGIVNRTTCTNYWGTCCYWSKEIQVKACSKGYYVYKLAGTQTCNSAYCTDPATSMDSCTCTDDEECRLVGGRYSCYCKHMYDVPALENLRPVLTCDTQEMKASFKKCHLKSLNLDPKSIHLTDSSCTGLVDYNSSDTISVVSPLKKGVCGNQFIKNGTSGIFKNTIYLSLDTNSSIGGEDVLSITYSCVYPLDMQITLDAALNPFGGSVNISIEGSGKLVARIALYQDAGYLTPYEGSKVTLTAKTMLYVGTILEGVDTTQFYLVMRNCYANPSANASDLPRYDIIRESCHSKQDSTINIIENGVSGKGKFSVQLFEYVKDLNTVFLHCEIHVCDVASETCLPSCSGILSRSSVSTELLSVGPIVKQAAATVPSPDSQGTQTSVTLWTSAALILALQLCFMILN